MVFAATESDPIDYEGLVEALLDNSPGGCAFLRRSSGHVAFYARGREAVEAGALYAAHPDYVRVEPIPAREQYRWMQTFAASVGDESVRERLAVTLYGRGSFRRFKEVLWMREGLRAEWEAFRRARLLERMNEWLIARGYPARAACPLPVRGDLPPRAPHRSPDASARDNLQLNVALLPPDALETAVAFLEFLVRANAAP